MAERVCRSGRSPTTRATSSFGSSGGARARWCDGEEPRSCCGRPRAWTCRPDRQDRLHLRGPGPRGASTTSTPTGSTPWPPSTPGADHRSSPCPSAGPSRRSPSGRPTDYGEPFSTWSLTKLADHLVRKGVVDDISHEGLRALLREEGVSFQAIKTWKESNDPDFEVKKNRVLELYDIADGKAQPKRGDPEVVICFDEFGPLNLQPHPGRQWAERDAKAARPLQGPSAPDAGHLHPAPRGAPPDRRLRPRRPTSSTGTSRPRRDGPSSSPSAATSAPCYPPQVRIAIVLDNFSPHLSTKIDARVGDWARGQQRRAGLHAALRQLAEPDRGPVHRPALLLPRRHRPREPRGSGLLDPALHRLAEPQRSGRIPT